MTRLNPQRRFWFAVMTAPALIGFILFALGPMAASLWLSFTRYDVVNPPEYIGLGNYTYLLLHDPTFWPSVRVTLFYAIISVPTGLAISLGVALMLNARVRLLGVYRTIYFLPSLLPATASGVIWVWIFDPSHGLLNHMLAAVGVEGPAWTQTTTWALPSLIIMGLWGFGGGMLIFLAGLQEIPNVLYEAAMIDGAGAWRRFRHVTLPMVTPILFFNLVMGCIGAMKVFDQAFVFGNAAGVGVGGPARATLFYVLNLYQKSFRFFHMGLGCAMAWLLFGAIMALTYANFTAGKRWVHHGGE